MKAEYVERPLGEVCTLQRGFDLPVKLRRPGQFPLVTSSGATDTHDEAKVAGPGVVTGRSGSIGNVYFIDDDFWPLNTALYVKDFHGNYPRYVFYLLQAFDLRRFASGAGVPTLNRNHVHDEPVQIATNLEEQKRIVAVLDQAFAALDRARANAEANLADAEALPQAAVDAVFLGASKGWQESTLGDVCSFVGGSQPPKSVFEYSERPGLIRLIQIRDYKSDAKAVYVPIELAKRFCDADDVMIGRYGPPLFQILRGLEGAYNVALMKAVPDESKVSKDFLFYFLKNREILRYIEGASSRAAGQAGINKATIEPYPILFPALEEQAAIVERLKSVWQRSEAIIQKCRERLEDLEALRQSILQKAFAGELT